MSENNSGGSKRVRSPGYPGLNLKEAIGKARDFYRAENRNAAALPIAFTHWGYSKKSGSGMKAVAALKSFGLIDVEGAGDRRRIKLSERGLRIILDDREGSKDRAKAIAEAAIGPKIHKKLWGLWGAEMPSHGNIRHYLIFEEKFNEKFVDDFIKEYKATVEYAKLTELANDELEDDSEDVSDIEMSSDDVGAQTTDNKLAKRAASYVQVPRHGHELAKFPVGNNCTISLVADGPYSKKSIEALVAQLKLNLELGIFDSIDSISTDTPVNVGNESK